MIRKLDLYIENNINKLLFEFLGVKDNTNKLLVEFGEMKDTMDTVLLITLFKDTNCPYNQRIKVNNILKKRRENIIRKFIKDNPNNANKNQINANIPINTTPAWKIKINILLKDDNPIFIKKYKHRKYSAAININKTSNATKINLKNKSNIAVFSYDGFSSKKTDSKYSNNILIKSKNDSIYVINNKINFNYYK